MNSLLKFTCNISFFSELTSSMFCFIRSISGGIYMGSAVLIGESVPQLSLQIGNITSGRKA